MAPIKPAPPPGAGQGTLALGALPAGGCGARTGSSAAVLVLRPARRQGARRESQADLGAGPLSAERTRPRGSGAGLPRRPGPAADRCGLARWASGCVSRGPARGRDCPAGKVACPLLSLRCPGEALSAAPWELVKGHFGPGQSCPPWPGPGSEGWSLGQRRRQTNCRYQGIRLGSVSGRVSRGPGAGPPRPRLSK